MDLMDFETQRQDWTYPTLIYQTGAGQQKSHIWAKLDWLEFTHTSIQAKKEQFRDQSVQVDAQSTAMPNGRNMNAEN